MNFFHLSFKHLVIGGGTVASGGFRAGDPQAVYPRRPCRASPIILGCHSLISNPDWPIIVSHRQDHNPKSQCCDSAAAAAAECKCRVYIDELANLFRRQNVEWGPVICLLAVIIHQSQAAPGSGFAFRQLPVLLYFSLA